MQKFYPCLWFDDEAETVADFYVKAFENGAIKTIDHYVDDIHKPKGSVLTVTFTLAGQEFMVLNGGPEFSLTPAISFYVDCETEEQLDNLWTTLSNKGKVLMELGEYPFSKKFGWVEDQFGVSWQLILSGQPQAITPAFLFTGIVSGKAEQAMNKWIDTFGEGEIIDVQKNPDGTVSQALFTMHGQPFRVMDGGNIHNFTFTMATSICMNCENQEQIDTYWSALTEKGKEWPCGWLEDEYGVSWQVNSDEISKLFSDSDTEAANRAVQALYKMKKIDLATLRQAYNGE